jgi:anti-sigma factor (TIGR02949 family)
MTSTGTPLSCLEMVARLDDYVDRHLDPEEIRRVETHLAGCLECAREYRFEATLLQGIRERLRRINLPPALRDAIHERLAREGGTIPGPGAL